MNEFSQLMANELFQRSLALVVTAGIVFFLLRIMKPASAMAHRVAWCLVLLQGWMIFQYTIPVPWLKATDNRAIAKNDSDHPKKEMAPTRITPRDSQPVKATGHNPANPNQGNDLEKKEVEPQPATAIKSSPTPVNVPASIPSQGTQNATIPFSWQSWLIVFWLTGIAVFVLRWGFSYLRFAKSLTKFGNTNPREGEAPAEPQSSLHIQWQTEWQKLLKERNISQNIVFTVHEQIGPVLCRLPGCYKIVVPQKLWETLSAVERRTILEHELAHFQRGDIWKSLAMRVLALPHWFNPCSWLAVRAYDEVAEWACDDIVRKRNPEAHVTFAKTLMQLVEFDTPSQTLRPAAFGSSIGFRVKRLLANQQLKDSKMKKSLIGLCTLAVLVLCLVRPQLTASDPQTKKKQNPKVLNKSQKQVVMDKIIQAWTTRQTRAKTMRIEWTEVRTHGVNTMVGNFTKAQETGIKMKQYPAKETSVRVDCKLSLDGRKMRFTRDGDQWSSNLEKFIPKTIVSAANGLVSKDYYQPNVSDKGAHAVGFINKKTFTPSIDSHNLYSIMNTFRALDPIIGQVHLRTRFSVISTDAKIKGVTCVLIEGLTSGKLRGQLWLDPQRDYVILRHVLFDPASPEKKIYLTVDIAYDTDPLVGLVPSAWETKFLKSRQGTLREHFFAKVTNAEFGMTIPNSEFEFVFPPGTEVVDSRTGEHYVALNSKRLITSAEPYRDPTHEQSGNSKSGQAALPESKKRPAIRVKQNQTKAGEKSSLANLRYDEKTFAEWQEILRTDLSPKQRKQAIRAFGAFGANGYPREAAEAIAEVAKYYDFSKHDAFEHRAITPSIQNSVVIAAIGEFKAIENSVTLDVLRNQMKSSNKARAWFAVQVIKRRMISQDSESYQKYYGIKVPLVTVAEKLAPDLLLLAKNTEGILRGSAIELVKQLNPNTEGFHKLLLEWMNAEDVNTIASACGALAVVAPETKGLAKRMVSILKNEPIRDIRYFITFVALPKLGKYAKPVIPDIMDLIRLHAKKRPLYYESGSNSFRDREFRYGKFFYRKYDVGSFLEEYGENAVEPLMQTFANGDLDVKMYVLFILREMGPKGKSAIPLLENEKNKLKKLKRDRSDKKREKYISDIYSTIRNISRN